MTKMGESNAITTRYIIRGPDEPGRKVDGMLWIDTSPPSGNAYTRSFWDQAQERWEIESSVGPNNPADTIHTAVVGSTWTDTSTTPATAKGYDGSQFASFGVSDHANLTNLSSAHDHANLTNLSSAHDHANLTNVLGSQHHTKPASAVNNAVTVSKTLNASTGNNDGGNFTTPHIAAIDATLSASNDNGDSSDGCYVAYTYNNETTGVTLAHGESNTWNFSNVEVISGFGYTSAPIATQTTLTLSATIPLAYDHGHSI